MNRVLMLAGVLALTALAAADAPAAGLLKKRGGCGCSQAAPPPAAYAPQPAAPCCGGPAVPTGGVPGVMPGMVMPAVPAAPAPAAPAAPGGHQHHSAAPAVPGTVFVSADLPRAADKEVTLTGTLVCAKCGLKEPGVKKCTNALRVKEGEKTVTYFLDDKGAGEDYHEGLCGGGTKAGATVTGTVSEKDGRKWVKATKVEEKK